MPFKAACSFSFQYVLIIEWQVKKPHTVVDSLILVCLSHGKQFQMGPVLCCYNTASALWHGKNALSPSGSERAIEGQPGLLSAAVASTVTQASGWRSNGLHTTLTLRLWRKWPVQKMKHRRFKRESSGRGTWQSGQKTVLHILVNIPDNFSGAKKSPMTLCIQSQCGSIVGLNAAVSTGA